MTEDEVEEKLNKESDDIRRRINRLAYEMKDDRNDGWVQEHYRNTLKQIESYLKKVLK